VASRPVARQRPTNADRQMVFSAGPHDATVEELLKAVFSVRSVQRLYNEEQLCLRANIKLTLRKALIRPVMTYTCATWELAADTYLLKLQRLQNKVLRTTGNFPRCTPVCNLHTAFNLLYVYNYITKYCIQQTEVIQNHENEHVRGIGQGEVRHRKYKKLKLGGGLHWATVFSCGNPSVHLSRLSLVHIP
jgi:hypothetical protein